MHLFLGVPMFASQGAEVIENRKAAWNDWYEEHRPKLWSRYRLTGCDRIILAPQGGIKVGNVDPITINFPENPSALVEKGLSVRFCLLAALDLLDRRRIAARSDALFVLIDGSGAFDFGSVYKVIDCLTSRASEASPPDLVFGTRPRGTSGMPEWRRAVEDFEHFILLTQLPTHQSRSWSTSNLPPDGQAGCWGLWLSTMMHLPISAPGYEIEFDLLASALMSERQIAFTSELSMATRSASNVADQGAAIAMSLKKLEFISLKLEIDNEAILQAFAEFRRQYADIASIIPENYVQGVNLVGRPISFTNSDGTA